MCSVHGREPKHTHAHTHLESKNQNVIMTNCGAYCPIFTFLYSSTLSRCVSWQMHRLRNFCHSSRTESLWAWKCDVALWANGIQTLTLELKILFSGACLSVMTDTCMVVLAGCFISVSLSPSSWSLFTSLSWDSRLLFLKFWWRANQSDVIYVSGHPTTGRLIS